VFLPTRYLTWAQAFYGRVPYDLASSGVPLARWSDLELPAPDLDDPGSYRRLREAIGTYNEVDPADVVPAIGASQAIFLAYAALLSPGDDVLVEAPGYEPLTRAAEGLGASVRTFPRLETEGFRIAPERVAAAIGPRTRAIVLSSLHNPSGVRVDDDTIRELAAIAELRGAYVIVDEVYAAFDALPEDGVFRRSARKLGANVIAISSLTKCFGLGMFRIGWLTGPQEIASAATDAAVATVGHLPLAHASYGAAAFEGIGRLARRANDLVSGKREIAARWVAGVPGARWSAPEEGLFGLVTLPGAGDLRAEIEALATSAGVLVAAGSFFGAPESFRLSWASCDRARFEEGLRLLDALVSGRGDGGT
jgi:hypothetical protein